MNQQNELHHIKDNFPMNGFPDNVSDSILFRKSRNHHQTNEDNTPNDEQNSLSSICEVSLGRHSLVSRTKYPSKQKEVVYEVVTEFMWVRQAYCGALTGSKKIQ